MKTSSLRKPVPFSLYWVIPTVAGLVWLGGLLALIGVWAVTGTPRYQYDSANIVFISDVGAAHKTLFICITTITSAFYIVSLFCERWLRHVDRIPSGEDNKRHRREVVYDSIAIIFCIIGSAALILLSIFDTFNHSTVHWSCTVVFVLAVAISAIFQTLEILTLKKENPDRAHLVRNAVFKLVVVGTAIAIAIAFAVCYSRCSGGVDYTLAADTVRYCNRVSSAAAVCEWTVAFILVLYFFSITLDLWPASKSSPRYLRRLERYEQAALEKMGVANPHHANGHVGLRDQRQSFGGETAPGSISDQQMRQV